MLSFTLRNDGSTVSSLSRIVSGATQYGSNFVHQRPMTVQIGDGWVRYHNAVEFNKPLRISLVKALNSLSFLLISGAVDMHC